MAWLVKTVSVSWCSGSEVSPALSTQDSCPPVGLTSAMTGGSGANYGIGTVALWDLFISEDGVPHVGVPYKDVVPTICSV